MIERVGRRKQLNINQIFGVEIAPYNETVSNTHKFTGHERDYYTNYDYMHFRFYASSMGRFMKPDNIIPDLTNPQNWNLYSYVRGNPVNFNDPTGHDGEETEAKLPEGGGDPNATSQAQQQIQEEQTGNKDNQEKKEDPPKGANDQANQLPINPVTGEAGINSEPQYNGAPGTIRSSKTNSKVGLFGEDVRKDEKGKQVDHRGLDINAPEGTQLYAAEGGEVIYAGDSGTVGGIQIKVKMADKGEYWYCHLSSTGDVKTGDKVKKGSKLGVTGKTGNAKNLPKEEEHLHLAVID